MRLMNQRKGALRRKEQGIACTVTLGKQTFERKETHTEGCILQDSAKIKNRSLRKTNINYWLDPTRHPCLW